MVQRGALDFVSVAPISLDPVKVGDLYELEVNISASFNNPYNASDVALDANFSLALGGEEGSASGTQQQQLSVPGFFYTPFQMDRHGAVLAASRGAPSWRVRFSPRLAGWVD